MPGLKRRRLLHYYQPSSDGTYESVPPGAFRTFDGTNDSLQSASTIDLSAVNKCAVVFWLWWDAYADNDDLALEFTANTNGSTGGFYINPNSSNLAGGGPNFEVKLVGNMGECEAVFARPSAAAWHQYVVGLDKSLSGEEVSHVYVDSVAQSLTYDTDIDNSNNFANDTLNVMSRNNASLFGAGRQARLGIIPGEIPTQAQVDDLYAGRLLTELFPAAYYWPIDGTSSPEPSADTHGIALTVNT